MVNKVHKLKNSNDDMRGLLREKEDKINELENELRVLRRLINEEYAEHYECIILEND
jgi:predicted RNase H-like nuclease (RuvC/YqgF family)